MAEGKSGTRSNLGFVAFRDGDAESSRDEGAFAGLERDFLGGTEIHAGGSGGGVEGCLGSVGEGDGHDEAGESVHSEI